MKNSLKYFVIVSIAAVLCACSPKKPAKTTAEENTKASSVAAQANNFENVSDMPNLADESIAESTVPEADIRSGDFNEAGLGNVYFSFNQYSLSDEARKTIEENSVILKTEKGSDVLVEGHCDERGTIEYNIALGQKRAKEVRDYYMRLGIAGEKITTISYGKEKPICFETDEQCWSKNRRAETKLRAQ